jgi:DNA-binding CsgD family transcriptional regulator
MIPMHPHLISQLIADHQADLMASARQQRLARQARAARLVRPAQRGRAAPVLAALGRLAWRRSSPRTIQTPAVGPGQAAPTLTPCELDLLKLLAQGLSNPDIAQQLVLSEHTVHRHLANILRKLGLSCRAAAAAWGVRTRARLRTPNGARRAGIRQGRTLGAVGGCERSRRRRVTSVATAAARRADAPECPQPGPAPGTM